MKTTFYTTLVPVTAPGGSYNAPKTTIKSAQAKGCYQNRPQGETAAQGVPIEVTLEFDESIFDPVKIEVKITKSAMVVAAQIEDLVDLKHELDR